MSEPSRPKLPLPRSNFIHPSAIPALSWGQKLSIWAVMITGILLLLRGLSPVLSPFVLSIILAYILQPGVSWLERYHVQRGVATLLMMAFLLFTVIFLMTLVFVVIQQEGPQIQSQFSEFAVQLKTLFSASGKAGHGTLNLNLVNLKELLSKQFGGVANALLTAVWTSLRTGGNLMISLIGHVFIVPLLLYYLLYDWHKILHKIRGLIPRRWLRRTLAFTQEVNHMLSQYLRGQLVVIGIMIAYYSICLSLAGFEIAVPLGMFTGIAIIIPYLGYIVGFLLALSVAVLQFGNWWAIGIVALIYGAGQALESSFLTPQLIGERIGLHPLAAILLLLAFGQIFGFLGILLALPAGAVLVIALREITKKYLRSEWYRS